MAVSLSKGGNISLSQQNPGLVRIFVGLGWDTRATAGDAFDLDASAFLLASNGKVRGDEDFIFYNQLVSKCGAVQHTGDNRDGQGDGDDESIKIDLERLSPQIVRIAVSVTIHDAQGRRQNFGQVSNAFMRIVNDDTQVEIARFDLSEDFSTETAVIFGEIYRHGAEWKFKAVGQGFTSGLSGLCKHFGVQLA